MREGEVPQALQFLAPTGSSSKSQPTESKTLQPVVDPFGNTRTVVQDQIAKEFAAIRAGGTMGSSEAATAAIKNVLQKYDFSHPT